MEPYDTGAFYISNSDGSIRFSVEGRYTLLKINNYMIEILSTDTDSWFTFRTLTTNRTVIFYLNKFLGIFPNVEFIKYPCSLYSN